MRPTAVRLVLWTADELVAVVDYDHPQVSVPVRWQPHRDRPWRCSSCGRQGSPTCGHTRAVDLAVRAQQALTEASDNTTKESTR